MDHQHTRGYRSITAMLRWEGWRTNHKRVVWARSWIPASMFNNLWVLMKTPLGVPKKVVLEQSFRLLRTQQIRAFQSLRIRGFLGQPRSGNLAFSRHGTLGYAQPLSDLSEAQSFLTQF